MKIEIDRSVMQHAIEALEAGPHASILMSTGGIAQSLRTAMREALASQQEPAAHWAALTDQDRKAVFDSLPDALDGFLKKWGWLHFAKAIEEACRGKNSGVSNQLDDINVADMASPNSVEIDGIKTESAQQDHVAAIIGIYEGEREPRLLSWNRLPNGEHWLYTTPQPAQQEPDRLHLAAMDLARKQADRMAELEKVLVFVERWAVHHAAKPHMTAENALSFIQHHPSIRAITDGYADGVVPDTFDPFARIAELEAEVTRFRADAMNEKSARQELEQQIAARVPLTKERRPLSKVLEAVREYLPPDGISAKDCLSKIIEVVDPWPLDAKPLIAMSETALTLMADNDDPGDWNSLNYQDCWHQGYKCGARAIEAAHGITKGAS